MAKNRAERRRENREKQKRQKEPVINIKSEDIQEMKKKATKDAADMAFFLMLAIPVFVLHHKTGWGKVRCERFVEQALDLYDSFETGLVTLGDLKECLLEEGGITLQKKD